MSSQPSHRRSQRLTAVLLLGGAALGAVGNPLHPHVATSMTSKLEAIAGNDAWVAIHVSTSIDGFAMKPLALDWASAS
jgi:anti-sigma factor RsiW